MLSPSTLLWLEDSFVSPARSSYGHYIVRFSLVCILDHINKFTWCRMSWDLVIPGQEVEHSARCEAHIVLLNMKYAS